MKNLAPITAALLLLGSSAAFAQYNEHSGDRGKAVEQERVFHNEARDEFRDVPHWSRGDRLADEYRSNTYVVQDWRGNHLRQPPRGYYWLHIGNRYVLASRDHGTVSQVIIERERH